MVAACNKYVLTVLPIKAFIYILPHEQAIITDPLEMRAACYAAFRGCTITPTMPPKITVTTSFTFRLSVIAERSSNSAVVVPETLFESHTGHLHSM